MYACMTAEHLHKWHKFSLTEPFGDEWRQAGVIAAAVQQPHARKGKRIKPEQFMPQVPGVVQRQNADMAQTLMAFAKQHNRHVDRKGSRGTSR